MGKFFYYLSTFADSGLSVFGVRTPYEQPKYQVMETIAPSVEIRAYAPRTVVETDISHGDPGQAFGRLFRYITGANIARQTVAMTAPVEQSRLIAMTVPVETTAAAAEVMRFYLPPSAGAPAPTEAGVRVTTLPATTYGVIRYSGVATEATRSAEATLLRDALTKAGKNIIGVPLYFGYDPPFALPFLRRNEVALEVK